MSLYVPIADFKQENCLGFVQFILPKDNVREDGYDFGFEQQLGAKLIGEYLTLILDKEFFDKTG